MSNLPHVTSKALELIRDADQYLIIRLGRTTDQAERESIERWRANLSTSAATITMLAAEGTPGDEPANSTLAELLDLTQQHIQNLHETDSYLNVNVVLSSLDNQLRLLADTHGPGSGNPIGRPR